MLKFFLILLLPILFTLIGCGSDKNPHVITEPNQNNNEPQNPTPPINNNPSKTNLKNETGGINNGIPYISISTNKDLTNLKKTINEKDPKFTLFNDLFLDFSILESINSANEFETQVEFTFESSPDSDEEFIFNLKGKPTGEKIKNKSGNYSFSLSCMDDLCTRKKGILYEEASQTPLVAWIYHQYKSQWKLLTKNISPEKSKIFEQHEEVVLRAKEVAYNFSRLNLKINENCSFSIEILNTEMGPIKANNENCDEATLEQISLIGKNDSGELLFKSTPSTSTNKAFLFLVGTWVNASPIDISLTPQNPPIQDPIDGNSTNNDLYAYEHFISINPNNSITKKLLPYFVKNDKQDFFNWKTGGKKTLQQWIDTYTVNPVGRHEMQNFISHMVPRFHEVSTLFRDKIDFDGTDFNYDIPEEVLAIMFIETAYFRSNKPYIAEVGTSGELGPAQFMPDVARWDVVGITNISSTRWGANICDDRGNFKKSTRGMVKFFDWLFDRFPGDPLLGILAYNFGPGNVRNALSKCTACDDSEENLRLSSEAGLNFWQISNLRLSNISPFRYDYVLKYLTVLYVLKNLEDFNFVVPEFDESKTFTDPFGQISCNQNS